MARRQWHPRFRAKAVYRSAAHRIASRASGHGMRSCVVQFIKADPNVGEVAAAGDAVGAAVGSGASVGADVLAGAEGAGLLAGVSVSTGVAGVGATVGVEAAVGVARAVGVATAVGRGVSRSMETVCGSSARADTDASTRASPTTAD